MRSIFTTSVLLVAALHLATSTQAQLTTLPDGGNKKAEVGERIGLTDVTISYSRPHVNGREGQIWGKLVAPGYTDQGFGSSKSAPWRAGANENTTIEFNNDVKVDGRDITAGKYALFVVYDPAECTLIFSKNNSSWGSFFYDPKEDALQVKVKAQPLPASVEWLKYEFIDQKENAATVALQWEKLCIPFTITVDPVAQQIASFRRELRTNKGFTATAWDQAAQFCLNHNTNLDEAATWADFALTANFVGERNFQTLSTKAQILTLQGKTAEADVLMKEALPKGGILEIHNYARQLVAQHRAKDALDVFKQNYDLHPNVFTTNMGMARGFSATGDCKRSMAFMMKAQAQVPDAQNKAAMDGFMKTLQAGKDFN